MSARHKDDNDNGITAFHYAQSGPKRHCGCLNACDNDASNKREVPRACEGFHGGVNARDAVGCYTWDNIEVVSAR
jgi:hypothetical protein